MPVPVLCNPPEPRGSLAGGVIELTDDGSEPPVGWLDSLDPPVIALALE